MSTENFVLCDNVLFDSCAGLVLSVLTHVHLDVLMSISAICHFSSTLLNFREK